MNLPHEVILDLWPLVQAGEASPATRALVEEYLRQHPELAPAAHDLPPAAAAAPPPEAELRALRRTRSILKRQRWLMSWALLCTGFALTFQFSLGGGHGASLQWLPFTHPEISATLGVAAAILWAGYAWQRRRLVV